MSDAVEGFEELEAEPAYAAELFGDRIEKARAYVHHLATTGVERGLIGPRELPRLWTRHVLNCGVVGALVEPGDTVGDIGSGAGLPGIPLALAQPDARYVLVEPMERRVEWLTEVVDDLGLQNVRIVRARVEELVDIEMFTVATARAVKSLAVLVEWVAPVLGPEGRLLALKGASVDQEILKAKKVVKKNRMTTPIVHALGEGHLEVPTRVAEVRRK
ncbi:16S rRNA (guanine(527)-N(7))-methyltransferase RsmG [Brevibacterium litoralis]|uniref:16S rRNA (guanine(527)-N(7))-methyltransferase RsmG n=1 Tax=Brevibacterium litoralis TaxID=3138935 RepID=UPI0032EAA921